MTNFVKKAVLATALGASALVAAAPAEAQRHGGYRGDYRGHYRGHDDTGTAIVAGIAGLAIGAAIAGNDRRYDYDRGYYRQHGYYPTDGYYYRNDYRRSYRGNYCEVRRVYDPYIGRRVAVRYCR